MLRNDPGLLESLIRVTTEEVVEESSTFAVESVLGIVVGNGLRFALGPIGFVLPADKILAWGSKIAFKTLRDYQERSRLAATAYDIRTTASGLLVAENTDPAGLERLGLPLPSRAEFPLSRLRAQDLQRTALLTRSALTRVDGTNVFRDIWSASGRTTCPECQRPISLLGTVQLGHGIGCSRNRFGVAKGVSIQRPVLLRPGKLLTGGSMRPCVLCGHELRLEGRNLTGHAAGCMLNRDWLLRRTALGLRSGPGATDGAARVAAWRNSLMNPANPMSPLNPNNPQNPNSLRNPDNPLNPNSRRHPLNPQNPSSPLNPNNNPANRRRR